MKPINTNKNRILIFGHRIKKGGIDCNENKLEIEEQINSNTNNESGEYPK